jgi:hypothetical protein
MLIRQTQQRARLILGSQRHQAVPRCAWACSKEQKTPSLLYYAQTMTGAIKLSMLRR